MYVMKYIINNLLSGGQKDAYFPSQKKETWVSPQTIEELFLQQM